VVDTVLLIPVLPKPLAAAELAGYCVVPQHYFQTLLIISKLALGNQNHGVEQ
jgi:hypothetical protein